MEVRDHLVDMHDVNILVVQVEEVDLVRELCAVEGALLDERDMEAAGVGVGVQRAPRCVFSSISR